METTKSDKNQQLRPLSQEQLNAIEHLLQGKSDAATAEAVGVVRTTIWEWRNRNPVFIAELNRQRAELWEEARERLKALANRAMDVVELQLDNSDPKISLAAAKYVLQGTKLLGDTCLPAGGPTTPEGVILVSLRREARREIEAKTDPRFRGFDLDPFGEEKEHKIETLAQSRLKKTLAEAGIYETR
jgi:hypothetical protein